MHALFPSGKNLINFPLKNGPFAEKTFCKRTVRNQLCGRSGNRLGRHTFCFAGNGIVGIQAKADGDGVIDLLHKYVVNMSHLFAQTRLIDGADLLEQNDGILDEPEALCVNVDMRRQFGFAETARDGGSDHGGTVFISDIILDDQDGTESALLAADDGTQVCVINISAFDNQFGSLFLF